MISFSVRLRISIYMTVVYTKNQSVILIKNVVQDNYCEFLSKNSDVQKKYKHHVKYVVIKFCYKIYNFHIKYKNE